MKKIFLAITLLLSLPAGAFAEALERPEEARLYKLYWGGMNLGNLVGAIEKAEDGYHFKVNMRSRGLARLITKYQSDTLTHFAFTDDHQALPVSFMTKGSLRKKQRIINIDYDQEGLITYENVNPPDKRWKRPAVKKESKAGSMDPLTMLINVRKRVIDYLQGGEKEFTYLLYEGRRLSKLYFTIHGKMRLTIGSEEFPVIHVHARRDPLEGFTNREKEKMAMEEPVIDMYLSDDEFLLPVKAVGEIPVGNAIMLLKKVCKTMEECS